MNKGRQLIISGYNKQQKEEPEIFLTNFTPSILNAMKPSP